MNKNNKSALKSQSSTSIKEEELWIEKVWSIRNLYPRIMSLHLWMNCAYHQR
jgi:hypothetical protein